jgi:hypothetical protein
MQEMMFLIIAIHSFAESLHFYAVPAPAQTFMRIPLPLYYKIAKFLK